MFLVTGSYLDLNYMVMVQKWNLIRVLVELKTNTRLVLMLKGYFLFIICLLVCFMVIYISFIYRSELDEKLKTYNKYYEGGSGEIRSREVNIILYKVKEFKFR